jgi:hypothetical protein
MYVIGNMDEDYESLKATLQHWFVCLSFVVLYHPFVLLNASDYFQLPASYLLSTALARSARPSFRL